MAMGPLRLHKGRHAFFCVEARAYAIARTGLCNRAPTYYEQSALLPPAGV